MAAHFVGNRRIETPHVILRHRDVFGKRAVAIDADDLDLFADVRLAGAAEKAGEIGDVAFGRHAIADAHRAHRAADRRDGSHELVPDDDRRLDALLRPRIPGVDVEIGAADAGLFDVDQTSVGPIDGTGTSVRRKPGPGPGLTSARIDEAMTAPYSRRYGRNPAKAASAADRLRRRRDPAA